MSQKTRFVLTTRRLRRWNPRLDSAGTVSAV